MGYVVLFIVLSIIIVFCVFMIVVTTRARKKYKRRLRELKERFSATDSATMSHVYGLELAESANCIALLCPDKLVFVHDQTEISLSFSKIRDILVKTNTEIQNSYVSSAGGAAAGALLFGPLGAIVGGRVKKNRCFNH